MIDTRIANLEPPFGEGSFETKVGSPPSLALYKKREKKDESIVFERQDQCETILWEGFWRVLLCGEIEGIEAFERADGRVLEVERLWVGKMRVVLCIEMRLEKRMIR
ncbi:hypothetical protein COLO4_33823 [Corchorus olitorius]|uniref:Uncharacterized protein n=1 Tax=Corchorus olitorius TaxID=93759 RepID=A0A1R3GQZ5_9ROSI|nr:hypothetical protein COLO4_33823 [Corchorus olitorius]